MESDLHPQAHDQGVVVALCLKLFATSVAAQELEPRAYSNAPVGFQFVVLAYS